MFDFEIVKTILELIVTDAKIFHIATKLSTILGDTLCKQLNCMDGGIKVCYFPTVLEDIYVHFLVNYSWSGNYLAIALSCREQSDKLYTVVDVLPAPTIHCLYINEKSFIEELTKIPNLVKNVNYTCLTYLTNYLTSGIEKPSDKELPIIEKFIKTFFTTLSKIFTTVEVEHGDVNAVNNIVNKILNNAKLSNFEIRKHALKIELEFDYNNFINVIKEIAHFVNRPYSDVNDLKNLRFTTPIFFTKLFSTNNKGCEETMSMFEYIRKMLEIPKIVYQVAIDFDVHGQSIKINVVTFGVETIDKILQKIKQMKDKILTINIKTYKTFQIMKELYEI